MCTRVRLLEILLSLALAVALFAGAPVRAEDAAAAWQVSKATGEVWVATSGVQPASLSAQAGGKLSGLVLDLRNDPGGLLSAAVSVSGNFLDGGTIVTLRGRDAQHERVFSAPGGRSPSRLPPSRSSAQRMLARVASAFRSATT